MHFAWLKGLAWIEGNELVDRLAKEAAVEGGAVVYDKMPREVIITRQKEKGLTFSSNQFHVLYTCKITTATG